MKDIVEGNIFAPDYMTIPTIQAPLPGNDPVVYTRGQTLSFMVKYPAGTKRLLFTVSGRIYASGGELFKQIVYPDPNSGGVAEFTVTGADTLALPTGMFYWDIFQLRDDGSRDIWNSYNKGTFNLVDSPSVHFLENDMPPEECWTSDEIHVPGCHEHCDTKECLTETSVIDAGEY
jgi:hypothetical protein